MIGVLWSILRHIRVGRWSVHRPIGVWLNTLDIAIDVALHVIHAGGNRRGRRCDPHWRNGCTGLLRFKLVGLRDANWPSLIRLDRRLLFRKRRRWWWRRSLRNHRAVHNRCRRMIVSRSAGANHGLPWWCYCRGCHRNWR